LKRHADNLYQITDENELAAAVERLIEVSDFPPGTPEHEEADLLESAIALYEHHTRKARRLQRSGRVH
jgi:hypothetical protein